MMRADCVPQRVGRGEIDPAQLMQGLARRRILYHSEADFQHAFAWEFHQFAPEWDIRLEVPIRAETGAVHLDLLACHQDCRVAIELKYKTRGLSTSINGEDFLLADHAAQDLGRYDFFKDLLRIETFVRSRSERTGYAIFLTNDSAYWKQPSGLDHGYASFAMSDGRKVSGALAWGGRASAGTRRSRESEIGIRGTYDLRWMNYSSVAAKRYGEFRYLCLRADGAQ